MLSPLVQFLQQTIQKIWGCTMARVETQDFSGSTKTHLASKTLQQVEAKLHTGRERTWPHQNFQKYLLDIMNI